MFQEIESQTWLILVIALVGLVVGIIFFNRAKKEDVEHANKTMLLVWFLLPLFPVLVLYVFFDNFAEGTILGLKLGGAVAAYAALLYFGWSNTKDAIAIDDLKQQLAETKRKLDDELSKKKRPPRLADVDKYEYKVRNARERYVSLVTGDIVNIQNEGLDIWVNTENTNMQMARYFDKNISGTIRFLGAKKNNLNEVEEDLIANELAAVLEGRNYVLPTTVVVTGAGELQNTHGVKKIFHVASVEGAIGRGYRAIDLLGQCVFSAMEKAEELNKQSEDEKLETMMIPILGTGAGGKSFEEAAKEQIDYAVSFFENNPQSDLKRVYFLASRQNKLDTLQKIIADNNDLSK
jgi:O-acetyl-ADP-ribose deacetylase (regulator of RNase III)